MPHLRIGLFLIIISFFICLILSVGIRLPNLLVFLESEIPAASTALENGLLIPLPSPNDSSRKRYAAPSLLQALFDLLFFRVGWELRKYELRLMHEILLLGFIFFSYSLLSMAKNPKNGFDFVNEEAKRCIHCPHPFCADGCPAGNIPRDFIKEVRDENLDGALDCAHVTSYSSLICGTVCDAFSQCQGHCILGKTGKPIQIKAIEKALGMEEKSKGTPSKSKGKKVAIVGSGPSGYNAAVRLALNGFKVTVFDRENLFGGIPAWGIPGFRLPKESVEKQFLLAKKIGIVFEKKELFRDVSISFLSKEFDAVLLATGAGGGKKLGVKGENLAGVFFWNNFLTDFNSGKKVSLGKKVLILGGGNTAIDSARAAKKIAKKVVVVYRRSENEMPAIKTELAEAKNEGVEFSYLLSPSEFLGRERISGARFEKMFLGEEKNGKREVSGTGEFFEISADSVIVAIGQSIDAELFEKEGIKTGGGKVIVDENHATSLKGFFAAGDLVTGPKTVAAAVKQGIDSAEAIMKKLGM